MSNPCSSGQTFQCPDGSAPAGPPTPCSSGQPQCCTGNVCSNAPQPGGQTTNQQGGSTTACVNPTCASPPCAAKIYGDVGCTTVSGVTLYNHELTTKGQTIASNAHIYGPFEAGFGSQQYSIIEGWGCTNPPDVYDSAGGLDLQIAEQKVAKVCNIELPRISGDNYVGVVGNCGGHTSDYHFHVRLSCLYTQAGGHSPEVGVVASHKLYGKWEDYDNNLLPLLDACSAHFGPTPDSNGAIVYHHHVQDNPPFAVGCLGPTANNGLVGVAACRALYSECDQDGGSGTTLEIKKDGVTQTVVYDRACPCFDATGSNMGTNIQELPALSSSSISYNANGQQQSSSTTLASTTASTSSAPGSTTSTGASTMTTETATTTTAAATTTTGGATTTNDGATTSTGATDAATTTTVGATTTTAAATTTTEGATTTTDGATTSIGSTEAATTSTEGAATTTSVGPTTTTTEGTETISGSMSFSSTSLSKSQIETATKKSLAGEFNVNENQVTATASQTRRLEMEARARLLAGSWSVSFSITVAASQAAAAVNKASSIQSDATSFNQAMKTNLQALGVSATDATITVSSFEAVLVTTTPAGQPTTSRARATTSGAVWAIHAMCCLHLLVFALHVSIC